MRLLTLTLALLLLGCDAADSTPEVPLDTTAPVITLLGANPMALDFGEAYVEPGATAQDDTDGDLSATIEIDAMEVDALTEGSYAVRYSVTDAAGNEAATTRTVIVGGPVDTTAPVLMLLGDNPLTLAFGTTYAEPGATAQDETDGDLSAAIEIDATEVDALVEGSYTVSYSVTDAAGNEASAARIVQVGAPPALGTTTYEVTFDATWSAATHPTDFPSNAHFSRLVGAVHLPTDALFEVGSLASDGIKDMAERGANSALQAEVEALDGIDFLSGPILNDSPDSGTMTFTADGDAGYTALTLVSMVAPSPDWFIGIDRLALVENSQWIDEATVELVVYDAGTDSGQSYRAANAATTPRATIAESAHAYFADDRRFIGTLTIRRLP